jgi:methionyl-tRNA synthetase
MQNLEDENSRTVIETASNGPVSAEKTAPPAPTPAAAPQAPAPAPNPIASVAAKAESEPSARSALKGHDFSRAENAEKASGALAPEASSLSPSANTPPSAPADAPSASAPQHIAIDDFAKVDLRVAQILVAERVPKADKLLRLEVDLGYEKRQILAGIAQYYEPEKLIGRKIVIVANLAPRKMRGLESNGMLLAASLEGGAPVLAGFLEDVPLGSRLK